MGMFPIPLGSSRDRIIRRQASKTCSLCAPSKAPSVSAHIGVLSTPRDGTYFFDEAVHNIEQG